MQTYKNYQQCTTILPDKNKIYQPDVLIFLPIEKF